MKQKSPKKTFRGRTAQTLVRSARIEGQQLVLTAPGALTTGAWAMIAHYSVCITPAGCMDLRQIGGWGDSALLSMNDWTRKELVWWVAQLDATIPGQFTHLIVDPDNTVVGRVDCDAAVNPPLRTVAFKINNAAREPVPAIGTTYSPPAAPVRPPRVRGPSVAT